MKKHVMVWLAAAVLALGMQSAWALTSWDADGVSGMTYMDSGKGGADSNFSTAKAAKLLINASEEDGQTHVLFVPPAALFDADLSLLAKAEATFHVTKMRSYDDRGIFLRPLAVPYEAATATWNSREAETAWEIAGGDVLTNVWSSGAYDADAQTLTFDLRPLLADADARAAFQANGALVQLDETERPEGGFVMFQLATALNTDESLQPEVFWVELDPYEDERDFAVSYIDSRDATTVFWEQAKAMVGKVVLNGMDIDVLLFLLLKEVVTGSDKAFPHAIAILFHHRADGLPLLLHLDELIGRFLPVGGIHERLGTLAQFNLAGQVCAQLLLHRLEKLGFLAEEVVT